MPAATFPDDIPASRSSPGRETSFETLRADFGDGYVQQSGAGINPKRDTWSLTWENINNDDADTVENFLDATLGYIPFYWTAPNDTASRLWVMDGGYTRGDINSLSRTITAKFRRWFGATPT